jgi:hypothetical protein
MELSVCGGAGGDADRPVRMVREWAANRTRSERDSWKSKDSPTNRLFRYTQIPRHLVVRMIGLEPTLPRGNRNLNPARLPISPHPHVYDVFEFTTFFLRRAVAVPVAVLDYPAQNATPCGRAPRTGICMAPSGTGAPVAGVCAHSGYSWGTCGSERQAGHLPQFRTDARDSTGGLRLRAQDS